MVYWKLAKMYLQVENRHWKSKQEGADFHHLWWGCKEVTHFWEEVGSPLSQITGVRISVKPRLMLLMDFTKSSNTFNGGFFINI